MTGRSLALASLSIVLAQISFNIGAGLAKGLFGQVGPEGVAALRTSIAAIILLAYARPWRAKITARQAKFLVLYGLAMGGMNLLIYWAIERVPIGIAVTVEIAGPLSVVLLTSRTLKDFLWFGLAVASLSLLVPWPNSTEPLDPLGLLFALAAAGFWALYIVFGKRAAEVKGGTAVSIGMTMACCITVPFGVTHAGAGLLQAPVLATGFAVAVLCSVLPYMLEMKALERLSSRLFGVIVSSAPAFAALCGYIMLGEVLTPVQWLAVTGMIVASAGCSLSDRPTVEKARENAVV